MDAVLLSRIQFGFSVGFHFLFPATTLGLTLYILIFESLFLKTRAEVHQRISAFLVRLLALVFVMGVATGATLEFSFGTNWARFSRFVGGVFGVPVAVEGITAFALEAVFLGILLFGRRRVSPGVYWWSAFLVFFGAHLSGFWIVAANSWMHTPAGYVLQGGRAVLTDFMAATLNPSTVIRFLHTILAGWLTGTSVVCALAAYYLLSNRHGDLSRRLLRVGILLFALLPLVQLVLGHASAVNVDRFQPAKSAALEGIFRTTRHAPLYLFGIPDAERRVLRFPVGIPSLLSVLVGWSPETPVRGLEAFPRDEWPPVGVVFTSFHVMVALGFALIGIGLLGGWLLLRRRLDDARWYWYVLLWGLPLPYLSFELGWVSTEIGRQPWIIYGVLRTAEASSTVVPAGQIAFSLGMLVLLYLSLLGVFLFLALRLVQRGPDPAPQEA